LISDEDFDQFNLCFDGAVSFDPIKFLSFVHRF